ncbi:MAG TPA: penicillin acylase family protein, partial [Burkholderiaceae bacterium]|nr:penicillin acylase family protein [Burkholderiaceae bacterium]
MRWLRRASLLLLGLLGLAVAALGAYLWRATPAHGGTLLLTGLSADVTIERDTNGIPTIRGASLEDVAFGLGVAHAQDRQWQLETHRRIGGGRLAEAFGRPALGTDRFVRALGVRRAAAAQWERLQKSEGDGESRRVLEAYTAGINAWQREQLGARAPEMLVLGVPVEDWTPVDSLAWALMMAWDLGGNWSTELLRARLALTLPVARIDELLPPYPGERAPATADYAALFRSLRLSGALAGAALSPQRIDQLLAAAPPSGIEGVGSNNWVVAGSHTASGAPLLANDPHLKITAPALWYFARLEVTGAQPLKVAGATMPGLPSVVLGQNEHIAWGFTNTGPDVQDLYLERFKPGDPMQVQMPGGPDRWAPLDSVVETIRIKGEPDDQLVVRVSRHGPLISDAGGVAATVSGDADLGIAMRWTALDADNDPVTAGLALARARSTAEFLDAAT